MIVITYLQKKFSFHHFLNFIQLLNLCLPNIEFIDAKAHPLSFKKDRFHFFLLSSLFFPAIFHSIPFFYFLFLFYYARVPSSFANNMQLVARNGCGPYVNSFSLLENRFSHPFFSFNQSALTNCRRFPKRRCISRSCSYKQKLISVYFISIKRLIF